MRLMRALWVAVLAFAMVTPAALAQEGPEAGGGMLPEASGAPVIVIETPYGPVTIETYPDAAPKTVARITALIRQGFYDGLTFHRVVPGFVVQGGDPTGTGRGGSGQTLPAEFNDHKHVLGTVAMARAQDPNSADSQFYISLDRNPHLDGQYTVFGQVIDGIDAVLQVHQDDPMLRVEVTP